MDFFSVALLISIWYVCLLFTRGLSDMADSMVEKKTEHKYVDDEPDGSNYVTMPNGDRRLD